jgi:hypothetical protein
MSESRFGQRSQLAADVVIWTKGEERIERHVVKDTPAYGCGSGYILSMDTYEPIKHSRTLYVGHANNHELLPRVPTKS